MSTYSDYQGVSIFSPDGKINSLAHINQSISMGTTALCITNRSSTLCVLLVHHPTTEMSGLQYRGRKVFVKGWRSTGAVRDGDVRDANASTNAHNNTPNNAHNTRSSNNAHNNTPSTPNKLSDNFMFTFSGITNDGLEIVNYLLSKSTEERVWKNRRLSPTKVFADLCVTASARTIISSDRLFGCGGILCSEDGRRVRIVEWCPTGIVKVGRAVVIGNRAQSCKTVLEKSYEEGDGEESGEGVVGLAVRAMRNAHGEAGQMGKENLEGYVLRVGEGVERIEDMEKYL